MKHPMYKNFFSKMLQSSQNAQDNVNLQDDRPQIYMSTLVESKIDENPPPFYLSLNIHKKLLHNFLLDSGASHNLMPEGVMEEQDLEITREYKDLYTFNSKQVKCVGVIKDLVVSLTK